MTYASTYESQEYISVAKGIFTEPSLLQWYWSLLAIFSTINSLKYVQFICCSHSFQFFSAGILPVIVSSDGDLCLSCSSQHKPFSVSSKHMRRFQLTVIWVAVAFCQRQMDVTRNTDYHTVTTVEK